MLETKSLTCVVKTIKDILRKSGDEKHSSGHSEHSENNDDEEGQNLKIENACALRRFNRNKDKPQPDHTFQNLFRYLEPETGKNSLNSFKQCKARRAMNVRNRFYSFLMI